MGVRTPLLSVQSEVRANETLQCPLVLHSAHTRLTHINSSVLPAEVEKITKIEMNLND